MRSAVLLILCVLSAVLCMPAVSSPQAETGAVRFAAVHIYLDSGSESPAAWQFEFQATAGQVKIVGIEGGEHPAFSEPPYYDPAALMNDRVIVGAFNTGHDLPVGKTRIATLHLQITGDQTPDYALELTAIANADGQPIHAEITCKQGESQ